jgi:cytochrome c oxidase assembly factor CtaG
VTVVAVDPWQLQADPEWAAALAIAAVDYAVVVRVLGRRGAPVSRARRAAFAAGLGLIAAGLLSPIEHIALTSLVSFHLLQNVMLADWAPPLLVLGLSPAMVVAAERRAAVRALTAPAIALPFWVATWYVLHLPAVYDYAVVHPWALGLEHVAFLTTGVAFWWPVLAAGSRMAMQGRMMYLFAAFIAASPVSFALALFHPLYPFYVHAPRLWGISPLEDQQIGGITMAVEQAVILFAACSVAFVRWIEDEGPVGVRA